MGHAGIVESVASDKRSFVMSQWNYPVGQVGWIDKDCVVTTAFCKLTRSEWQVNNTQVVRGFIYPSQPRSPVPNNQCQIPRASR
jgi:hypothetical protein